MSGGESRNVMAITESPSPVLANNVLEKQEPEHRLIFWEMAMILGDGHDKESGR
jgi:hypothetical protein